MHVNISLSLGRVW